MAMAVNKICAFYGMNELEAYKVELCVTEAVTNAIVHAYGGRPGYHVCLLVSVVDSALLMDCTDRGKPMTAEQANRVSASSAVMEPEGESLREGGRGLQIIRGVMDKVTYMTDEGLNCLSMVKLLKDQTRVESGSQ